MVSTSYEGVDVVIDRRDAMVSRVIKEEGSFQHDNVRTFGRLVKEGDNILNIGSHIGLECILYAKLAGPKGKLFMFEPYPVTYNILLKNIYLNNLDKRATLYNVAASST